MLEINGLGTPNVQISKTHVRKHLNKFRYIKALYKKKGDRFCFHGFLHSTEVDIHYNDNLKEVKLNLAKDFEIQIKEYAKQNKLKSFGELIGFSIGTKNKIIINKKNNKNNNKNLWLYKQLIEI